MATLTYSLALTGLGGNISRQLPRTSDGGITLDVSVPKGYAGTLSTRTDNETGTLTLGSGHGITTGAIIDLYWATGTRTGITVGTVSGTSVPIGADNAGSGNNLPTATTAIVASVRVPFNIAIDGDNLAILGLQMVYPTLTETAESRAIFVDAADDVIATLDLTGNEARIYDIEAGDTNPFTGDPITDAYVSNGSSAYDATLRLLGVQDATP